MNRDGALLWYLNRSTGLVSLLLMTLTIVLGAGLLALTVAAVLLPGSEFVETLARGAL